MDKYYDSFCWPKEFFENDQRFQKKTKWQSYEVSQNFFQKRHGVTLTPHLLKDAKVLDLGCYLGATGYWVLNHGAKNYTGIEILKENYNFATEHLSTHFDNSKWSLKHDEIHNFIKGCKEKYDIVIAWGVFNSFTDPILVLEDLFKLSDCIFIDCAIPMYHLDSFKTKILNGTMSTDEYRIKDLELGIVQINPYSSMLQARAKIAETFQGTRISLGAIKMIAERFQFKLDTTADYELQKLCPDTYGITSEAHRMMIKLVKDASMITPLTYKDLYWKLGD